MSRYAYISLILCFIVLYAKGLLLTLGVPKLLIEGPLLALPVIVLLGRRENLKCFAPGVIFVLSFTGWSVVACLYHGESVLQGLLFSRYLIAGYVVLWAVWHSRFSLRQIRRINTVVFAMFFVQVFAALYEVFVIGEKRESIVGTMCSGGGAIATVFPMFAFGFMLAFFLFYNRIIFLIAGYSFLLVGFASGKLAIYYMIPMVMLIGLFLFLKQEGRQQTIRRSVVIGASGFFVLLFVVLLVSNSSRTESIRKETGTKDRLLAFLAYTRESELHSSQWNTGSRTATSRRIIEETFKRPPMVFLFGQGTDVFYDTSIQKDKAGYPEYGIIYGIVGWSTDALAIGWPAVFLHVGFYTYMIHLVTKRHKDMALKRYWKAMLLATQMGFGIFLLAYFFYSKSFTVGNWLNYVHLYFLAVLAAPQYQKMISDVTVN